MCQHLTVARIAESLAVSWNTANDAVLAEGRRVLIDDPARFDGVRVTGVDEHCWRCTRRGDKFVTVIIDLTPIRDGTGPARLLDMVEGPSQQAFQTWLAGREQSFRDNVEVVAMDGFTGFTTGVSGGLCKWRLAAVVSSRRTGAETAATRAHVPIRQQVPTGHPAAGTHRGRPARRSGHRTGAGDQFRRSPAKTRVRGR